MAFCQAHNASAADVGQVADTVVELMNSCSLAPCPVCPSATAEMDDGECDVGAGANTKARVVGYAYGSVHRTRISYQWTAETSCYIEPGWHRRGIGRALYTALLACLRAQGICNVVSGLLTHGRFIITLQVFLSFPRKPTPLFFSQMREGRFHFSLCTRHDALFSPTIDNKIHHCLVHLCDLILFFLSACSWCRWRG